MGEAGDNLTRQPKLSALSNRSGHLLISDFMGMLYERDCVRKTLSRLVKFWVVLHWGTEAQSHLWCLFLNSRASPKSPRPHSIQTPQCWQISFKSSKSTLFFLFFWSTSLRSFSFFHLWAQWMMLIIHLYHLHIVCFLPEHSTHLCYLLADAGSTLGPGPGLHFFPWHSRTFGLCFHLSPNLALISPAIVPSWVCSCGPNLPSPGHQTLPILHLLPHCSPHPASSQLPFHVSIHPLYLLTREHPWASRYLSLLLSEDEIVVEVLCMKV